MESENLKTRREVNGMLVLIIIILIHLVTFVGIVIMIRRYRPLHFHSQNAFSVILGIYLLFFILTAIQTASQMTVA